jgi:Coenzyme PQQ synthesis protein D (PqqD)
MTKFPAPPKHVITTAFDNGEGVLIDVQTKRYYQLNDTAFKLWQSVEAGHTPEQAIEALTSEFEVTPEHAAVSLAKLIGDLQQLELLPPA